MRYSLLVSSMDFDKFTVFLKLHMNDVQWCQTGDGEKGHS